MQYKLILSFLLLALCCKPAVAEDAFVSVGDFENSEEVFEGFSQQNAPILWTYIHSGCQVLYQADDIAEMQNKQIDQIKFKFDAECYISDYQSKLKAYIQEVDETTFTFNEVAGKYEWTPVDQSAVALEADLTYDFTSDELLGAYGYEFVLDLSENPYQYHGKNIILTIVNDAEGYIDTNDGIVSFYSYYPAPQVADSPYRTLIYGSDLVPYFDAVAADKFVYENASKFKDYPLTQFVCSDAASAITDVTVGSALKMNTLVKQGEAINVRFALPAQSIKMYDLSGNLVYAEAVNSSSATIDAPLTKGIYFVKVDFASSHSEVVKISVQ